MAPGLGARKLSAMLASPHATIGRQRHGSISLPRALVVVLTAVVAMTAPGAAFAGDEAVAAARAAATAGRCPVASAQIATLCLLNAERTARGLAPLRAQRTLAGVAAGYASTMVRDEFFAHTSPSGSTVLSRIQRTTYLRRNTRWWVGENIAWGSGTLGTPREVVAAWMASPGHRANILDPRFREIGIGIADGAPAPVDDGETARTCATDFGRRSAR
jgi:uncharacterized protein YkwD